LEQGGANGDAAIQIAVEGKIANTAAVGASRALFQFRNDLHGADFRRAAERSGWESGAHQIVGGLLGGEAAFDLRDDVHDVAVPLDDHQIFDLHGAKIAGAANVIAREIDQHDVFGAFLWIGQQFLFQGEVFFRRFAAAPRAGNRTNFDFAILAAHVNFW